MKKFFLNPATIAIVGASLISAGIMLNTFVLLPVAIMLIIIAFIRAIILFGFN